MNMFQRGDLASICRIKATSAVRCAVCWGRRLQLAGRLQEDIEREPEMQVIPSVASMITI